MRPARKVALEDMDMVRYKRGFTLIEMAVVLVIVGLVLATTLPLLTERIAKQKATKGVQGLNILKQEIIGFAIANARLPTSVELQNFSGYEDVWDNPVAYYPATGLDSTTISPSLTTTDLTLRRTGSTGSDDFTDQAFIIASRGPNVNLQIDEDADPGTDIVVETYAPGYASFESVDNVNTSNDIGSLRLEPFDDVVDYVSLAFLQSKLAAASNAYAPTGGAGDGFDSGIADKIDVSGTSDGSTKQNTVGTVTIDAFTDELRLGNGLDSTRACVWYQAESVSESCDEHPTEAGVYTCDPAGWLDLRFIFRYEFLYEDTQVQSTDYNGGFVFTIMTAATNSVSTDPPCGNGGGARPSLMGYSSNASNGTLYSPKFGIEVDLYRDYSGAPGDNDRQDPDIYGSVDAGKSNNHIAAVFWGDLPSSGNILPTDVNHQTNEDDNTHGVAQNDDETGTGLEWNSVTDVATNQNWFEDKAEHWIRVELSRDSATVGNNVTYTLYAWVDDAPDATFLDLSANLHGADTGHYDYKVEDSILFGPSGTTVQNLMDDFRFGWTMATGDATYQFNDISIGQFDYQFE